jgi:hypothetical protein
MANLLTHGGLGQERQRRFYLHNAPFQQHDPGTQAQCPSTLSV